MQFEVENVCKFIAQCEKYQDEDITSAFKFCLPQAYLIDIENLTGTYLKSASLVSLKTLPLSSV